MEDIVDVNEELAPTGGTCGVMVSHPQKQYRVCHIMATPSSEPCLGFIRHLVSRYRS